MRVVSEGVQKSINGGEDWFSRSPAWPDISFMPWRLIHRLPATVYAGTNRGVFVSLDGGENWRSLNSGLSVRGVYDLAIDPALPNMLYAGTWGGAGYADRAGLASGGSIRLSATGPSQSVSSGVYIADLPLYPGSYNPISTCSSSAATPALRSV